MRNIMWLGLIAVVLGTSCADQAKYLAKGYFANHLNYPEKGSFYVTPDPGSSNDLIKLPRGFKNYYAWKTVRYNVPAGSQRFSSYKTLCNEEIPYLSPEERRFVRTEKHILNNYLFFIDDYRFIYLSEDDKRDKKSGGTLRLFFDNDEYKLKGEEKEVYRQLLRGYYEVKGDEIFFDFGSKDHFYVKGIIHNRNKISLDSIFVPRATTIKRTGMNASYKPFDEMLNPIAQPLFELPTSKMIVNFEFDLSFGFLGYDPDLEDQNVVHQDILQKASTLPDVVKNPEETRIIDIRYDFEDMFQPKRIYDYLFVKEGTVYEADTFHYTEDLFQIPTW